MTNELDLLITGGSIVTPSGVTYESIGVADGRIVGLFPADAPAPGAAEVLDISGRHVLPGGIDAHVHTRAPSRPDRETWESGTAAAARSGITTIIEMPMSDPPGSTAAVIRNRLATAEGSCHVDYAMYGGGGWQDERSIREQADEGIVAYKLLSHGPPPGREREFVGLFAESNAELYGSLRQIAKTGLPAAVHAEDASLLHLVESEVRAAHQGDPRDHALARPVWVEEVSVSTLLILARETGARLHLPHIGSATALKPAADARRNGQAVTIETSPHYLSFDESLLAAHRGFAKMNPPLRSPADRDAMWAAIEAGDIDIVASDHGPNLASEKQGTDIWAANAGNPGIEALYPVLIDGALRGRVRMEKVADVMAAAPARIFGLPGKGRIEPGYDADFMVCDTAREWVFHKEDCASNSRDSYVIYDGRTFKGVIEQVFSRGRVVAVDGRATSALAGRFITPN